jgi:hypothetical protein
MIKNQKKVIFNNTKEVLYLFLLCILCNWMLLLNDGFFWDDNLLYNIFEDGHYSELFDWGLEMGLPLNIIFYRGLEELFGVKNYRLLSFFSIFLSSVLVNQIFKHYTVRFSNLSLVFTTLYLALYPFRSSVLLCTTVYQVMLLLFLLAVYLRSGYQNFNSRLGKLLIYICFSILSFISFNTASIIVIFYFYLLFDYFYSHNFSIDCLNFKNLKFYFKKWWFIVVLPLIYWYCKLTFFPAHGRYQNYNKITFDLYLNFQMFYDFYRVLFIDPILYFLNNLKPVLIKIILCVCIALLYYPRAWILPKFKLPLLECPRKPFLPWAIIFLFISALPYVLVSQPPRFQGWESRHLLLFTLSLPIFVFALLIALLDRVRDLACASTVNFIFRPLILCIVLIGVINANKVYLDYQLLAIKQWSVVENLKAQPELKKYSRFIIYDNVGDFSKNGFSWREANHEAFYGWVAIFKKAWGGERWYANNHDERHEFEKSDRYGAADINPGGESLGLVLTNTDEKKIKTQIVLRYWKLKYFGGPSELREFLLSIVAIEPCGLNVSCKN